MVSNVFTAKASYDVFLSYNSADDEVVEDVARKLRDEGLEPFLDRWYLAPGARWRSRLEDTLSSCKAVAIFVGPGEMGSWQQREVDVALDLQSRSPNLPVIPVLLPGCEPPLGFLRQLTWVDLRTQTRELGIVILAKAARGEAPGPDLQKHLDAIRVSICPYRGLLHFREEDAPFFFGREAAIDKLVDVVQRQPLVTVVGASGSGKSSVVRAGLVPRLRSDRRTAWETMILVPTDQPLRALARAFVPLLEPTMGEVDRLAEATKLAEHFRSGTISLYDIVERVVEKQSGTNRVLIVVDQFEELYTLTSDEEARRRFLDELLAASSRAGSKANIALTLRGDFVGRALAYRPLSDRLQDAQINLGPMTRQELECAIRKPAEKIQLEFEPGLVGRILNDVGDEPGNLPLLEFVLKELWWKRRGRILLNETYDAIGGLQGAVATKADEFLKGLSPAEEKTLQRVFLRIVRPLEGGLDTRRRAAFAELPPEGVDLVVKLANERLLVTNQSASGLEQTVEVAHEALISNWSTLRAWVNEDREFLLWRDRLGPLVAEWKRAQESDEALLRGPILIEAQKWFDQRSQDLADQERKFISKSRELRERQRRHRAFALAGSMTVVSTLLVLLLFMWRGANEQARIAESRRLAAESTSVLAKYPQRSLLLAVEAVKLGQSLQKVRVAAAERSLREALAFIGGRALVIGKPRTTAAGFSPDNHWLVTGGSDGIGWLWDLSAKDPAASPVVLRGHESKVNAVGFSPDNHWLVTGSSDGTARLWDLSAKNPAASPIVLRGHDGEILAVAISPDNHWLVTGSPDGTARLWDLSAKNPAASPIVLRGHDGKILAVAISPDNHWLVTGSSDGTARLWDLSAKNPAASPVILPGHGGEILAVAISPDNHWLATSGSDGTARLWDLSAKDQTASPVVLRGHESWVNAVGFSLDNHWLVTGSYDKTARLWDLGAKDPATTSVVLRGHDGGVSALGFSPDNHWLVTGSYDKTARLWDLSAKDSAASTVVLRGHESGVSALGFSPDNHWLVTGGSDGSARLWDMSAKDQAASPVVLRGHESWVNAVGFSLDNHWLVTGSYDKTARLWDLGAKNQAASPVVLRGHEGEVLAVAISPDNRWAVTASDDKTARLWDLSAKDPAANPIVLRGHEDGVGAVAISPDNRWVVTGSLDKTARLWDLSAKDPAANPIVLHGHDEWVRAVAISPDNRWVVTGSEDKTARLWDLSAKDPAANPIVLRGHEDGVRAVAISPDNRWVVTGSWDKTARLWDLSAKDPAANPVVLRGHEGAVDAVAISPDNRWVVTGSEDQTARLWDLSAKDPAADPIVLRGHDGPVRAVAISPDNRWVVTGSDDKTARLWLLQINDLINLARVTAVRNFSADEWQLCFPGEKYRKTFDELPSADESGTQKNN